MRQPISELYRTLARLSGEDVEAGNELPEENVGNKSKQKVVHRNSKDFLDWVSRRDSAASDTKPDE